MNHTFKNVVFLLVISLQKKNAIFRKKLYIQTMLNIICEIDMEYVLYCIII